MSAPGRYRLDNHTDFRALFCQHFIIECRVLFSKGILLKVFTTYDVNYIEIRT